MFAKKNVPKSLSRSLEKPKIASLPRLFPWAIIKVFVLATAAIFVAAVAIAHKLTAAPIALWVPLTPAPATTELQIEYLEIATPGAPVPVGTVPVSTVPVSTGLAPAASAAPASSK